MMKAIVRNRYGTPDQLRLRELAKPTPKANELLIKIEATALNASDWELLSGKPFHNKLVGGLPRPTHSVLGSDVAGWVAAVGKDVKRFKEGDAVLADLFNDGFGGLAAYTCVRETTVTHKPPSVSFAHAATIPQSGVLALQGVRDHKQLKAGDRVLINGAGGGTGTFAIQLAKRYGAEITAVDSAEKFPLMQSLGADHVIDYKTTNYTKSGKQYDLIIDFVADRSLLAYRRVLKPDGVFIMVGGKTSPLLQAGLLGPLLSRRSSKKLGLLFWKQDPKDYEQMLALFEQSEVQPVIDRCYSLEQSADALWRLGNGRCLGNLIILPKVE